MDKLKRDNFALNLNTIRNHLAHFARNLEDYVSEDKERFAFNLVCTAESALEEAENWLKQ